ncbi:MAG TPA: hypothetical protein VGM88_08980 [Kofleriaceae bacterium]|jgi:hypothetical protein
MANATKTVTIRVAPGLANDLKHMQLVEANVLKLLGCPTCHSGFRLEWQEEIEFLARANGEVVGVNQILARSAGEHE